MNHPVPSGNSERVNSDIAPQSFSGIEVQFIRQQLEKILASQAFANAERLSRFLRFTVEKAIQGEGDQIKEYLLGLEVFDRNHSYDPRMDPIVRVEAGRLRAKLNAYYENQGRDDSILIEYRKGSYVPAFRKRVAVGPRAGESSSSLRFFHHGKMIMLLIAAGLMGGAIFWFAVSPLLTVLLQKQQETGKPVSSLAVLPFENLSHSPEQDSFADAMTDALMTELSKMQGLQVKSRTSMMRYKGTRRSTPEIARELNVNTIVAGSVTVLEKRVRINVYLIDAASDMKLWADSYERDMSDVLRMQNEVARAIADEIRIRLEPKPSRR